MTTFDKKTKTLLLHEIEAEYDSSDKMLELHSETYQETGNPIYLLSAFCYQVVTKADSGGSVSIPQWMSTPLAEGFAAYLNGLAGGENASLDLSLQITDQLKANVRRGTDLGQTTVIDDMVVQVYILRWLFGLNGADAVRVTYKMIEGRLSKMKLDPVKNGITQSWKSFKNYYDRTDPDTLHNHSRHYKVWAKERDPAQMTESHRQQILSTMSKDLAAFVKANMKPKTL